MPATRFASALSNRSALNALPTVNVRRVPAHLASARMEALIHSVAVVSRKSVPVASSRPSVPLATVSMGDACSRIVKPPWTNVSRRESVLRVLPTLSVNRVSALAENARMDQSSPCYGANSGESAESARLLPTVRPSFAKTAAVCSIRAHLVASAYAPNAVLAVQNGSVFLSRVRMASVSTAVLPTRRNVSRRQPRRKENASNARGRKTVSPESARGGSA